MPPFSSFIMWTHKNTFAIGGLRNIGYASSSDFLLVLSSQGEGIFNCITGEKVARKYNCEDWYAQLNQQSFTIRGFDVLQESEVVTCWLYGGDTLPKTTKDGWQLKSSDPEPDDEPFQQYMVKRIYLISPTVEKAYVGKDGACYLRTFGFSHPGNSFVTATSCDLIIYSRP